MFSIVTVVLSPSPFRGFLPPNFVYRSLQGGLHRSLGKGRDVIIRWGNILSQISKPATSAGLSLAEDLPSTTPALQ